jgi:hypothetical protein
MLTGSRMLHKTVKKTCEHWQLFDDPRDELDEEMEIDEV